ncbi:MAG: glycoside hydrolase domain-containing protein [Elusimicrobiota bacterium]
MNNLPLLMIPLITALTSGVDTSRIPEITDFVKLSTTTAAENQTKAAVWYDDTHLCFKLTMFDPAAMKLSQGTVTPASQHDGSLWREDSIELFISPVADGTTYFHILTNPVGAVFDQKMKDVTWASNAVITTNTGKESWDAVIKIPFVSFGVTTPQPNDVWRLNICRNSISTHETSSWIPAAKSFHSPASFGKLVFGGEKCSTAQINRHTALYPDKNVVTYSIYNNTGEKKKYTAKIYSTDIVINTLDKPVVEQRIEYQLIDGIQPSPTVYFVIAETTTDTELLRTILPSIPSLTGQMDTLKHELSVAEAAVNTLPEDKRTGVINIIGEAKKVYTDATVVYPTTDMDIRKVNASAAVLAYNTRMLALTKNIADYYALHKTIPEGFIATPLNPLIKVFKDSPYTYTLEKNVELNTAKDEYTSFQVIVIPTEQNVDDVNVELTDLKCGDTGAVISSKDNIKLSVVCYVKTGNPVYPIDRIGWFPDPLLDFYKFKVKFTEVQPVWVTIHVPAETQAGNYKGKVKVTIPGSYSAQEIPVTLRVYNFVLPRTSSLPTAFQLWDLPEKMYVNTRNFMLDYRVSLITPIYQKPEWAGKAFNELPVEQITVEYEDCFRRGLNVFNFALFGYNWPGGIDFFKDRKNVRKEDLDFAVKFVTDYSAYLRKHGWLKYAYVYTADEPKPEDFVFITRTSELAKKYCPALKILNTTYYKEHLTNYIDIFCPTTANFDTEIFEKQRNKGTEFWWYVCLSPRRPYANLFIDYPAIDHRLLFWQTWQYKSRGFLYWGVNVWGKNTAKNVIPNEYNELVDYDASNGQVRVFNGDGFLLYPGPGEKALSTLRFECLRDGIQDYEYFVILQKKINELKKNGKYKDWVEEAEKLVVVPDTVSKSVTEFSVNPEFLLEHRNKIGEHLDKVFTK